MQHGLVRLVLLPLSAKRGQIAIPGVLRIAGVLRVIRLVRFCST